MSRLPRVNVEAIFVPGDFYTYKFVSLHKIIDEIKIAGDWAQFGVYKGRLARFLSLYLTQDRQLHLFDSFEGLPSDWVGIWKAGTFALAEDDQPVFDSEKIRIYKGWFSDTVPDFGSTLEGNLAFIHMDCDLYSSAKDVLTSLDEKIVNGTVILFDEYMMESNGETDDGEHRALIEWSETYGRTFEYLWRTNWMQVAIRVTN